MRKISLILISLFTFGTYTFSQSTALNLNVGARFMGNNSDLSKLTPGLHLDGGLNYMINDYLGIKGDVAYDGYASFHNTSNLRDRSFMIRGSVQGVLSLSNLFEFESRDLSLLFHAGFGFASNYNPNYKSNRLDNGGVFSDPALKGNDDMVNIIFGITPQYRIKGNWFGDEGKGVTITITAPKLTAASLAGSGDFTADKMEGDAVEVKIAGSGSLKVAQVVAKTLETKIAGSGDAIISGTAGANASIAF